MKRKEKLLISLASTLISFLVKLMALTWRFNYLNKEILEKAEGLSPNKTFLLGLWHQNIVAGLMVHRTQKYTYTGIVSASKDGEIASKTSHKLGIRTVRGSSSKGGAKALTALVNVIKNGSCGAITIDGPRGPNHDVKRGIIEAAKLTGSPIVPMLAIPSNYWEFRSWDKFRFPKPFCKITIHYGEPIHIPADTTPEDYPRFSKIIKDALESAEEEIS